MGEEPLCASAVFLGVLYFFCLMLHNDGLVVSLLVCNYPGIIDSFPSWEDIMESCGQDESAVPIFLSPHVLHECKQLQLKLHLAPCWLVRRKFLLM